MKYLNYLDLGVQTFIIGAVVLLTVAISFTGQFDSIAMIALYGAVFLGPWQMVSSLVTCLARGLYFKWRLIHLLSSIGYMVIFGAGAAYASQHDPGSTVRALGGVFGFLIPVVLAGFYYFITIKSFQLARANARLNKVGA